MSEIDIQNAKQIRDPMDVLITMSLADDDVTMTYSGYSSAKVADGELDEHNWPMRKLADLQDDGFPLDGSCVLYDASTTPSQANGKLGVRSNVGETVTVTATGDRTMASIGASVTGAESVTMNGTTTPITGTNVTLPLLDTTATLTFNPASETSRIEINTVLPEADFKITNENLIRATVSLRSDLSIVDPTLPESEINIEAYFDEDVSESVASIPADTPITYSAGYAGDMSRERKFYVSGQVKWADNVLTIHGVDAVHFMDDVEIHAPITDDYSDHFLNVSLWLLARAGIEYDRSEYYVGWFAQASRWVIRNGVKARDMLAFLMRMFSLTNKYARMHDGSGYLNGPLDFAYVDAGWPTIRTRNMTTPWEISQEDCGEITTDVEPPISTVEYEWERLVGLYRPDLGLFEKVGTATWIKGVGTSLSFDKYTHTWEIGFDQGENFENEISEKISDTFDVQIAHKCFPIVPTCKEGYELIQPDELPRITQPAIVGDCIMAGDVAQGDYTSEYVSGRDLSPYTQFVPWSQRYPSYPGGWVLPGTTSTQMWNNMVRAGIIADTNETVDLDIFGNTLSTEKDVYVQQVGESGREIRLNELPVIGEIYVKRQGGQTLRVFPDRCVSSQLYSSLKTGSFRWKGDPRMQPRDYAKYELTDGTKVDITLENITLTHEGGGTYADITYREGVV